MPTEKITLSDTGEFYESLEDKEIIVAPNKSGAPVVVGIIDKKDKPSLTD